MPEHHPLRGAMLCIAALALFACMDTTTKYLTQTHAVPLIVGVRYLGNLLLMVAFLGPTHSRQMVRTTRTGLVWVRAFCLAVSSLLIGLALERMPVAEMTAITFLSPILLVAVAGRLLGERVGWIGWAATLGGLAGVMLIVRPGSDVVSSGAIFVLAASETTFALLFYTALAGSILYGLALPWYLEDRAPSLFEAALFASLGVYGGVGHFLFTAAFRHAPASLIAPLNYIQLLWAGLLGWLVFNDIPDAQSLVGMAVVAGSGVLVAVKTRRPPVKRTA
jgi:drug/metabolite transporter (DMT)-like permease